MKLYVVDANTKNKTPLRIIAPNRQKLLKAIKKSRFSIGKNTYTINDVKAEPSSDSVAVGGLLGGVVGLLGGVAGVIIGGLLGVIIGWGQAQKDEKDAELFNGSNE